MHQPEVKIEQEVSPHRQIIIRLRRLLVLDLTFKRILIFLELHRVSETSGLVTIRVFFFVGAHFALKFLAVVFFLRRSYGQGLLRCLT